MAVASLARLLILIAFWQLWCSKSLQGMNHPGGLWDKKALVIMTIVLLTDTQIVPIPPAVQTK